MPSKEHYISKKQNRNVTLDSLISVVILLYTNNKAEFIRAYNNATHDNSGKGVWTYMHSDKTKI